MTVELRTVTRDGEGVRQLRCPGCGVWGDLDDDQLHGRVSVHHAEDEGGCGYHETRDFRVCRCGHDYEEHAGNIGGRPCMETLTDALNGKRVCWCEWFEAPDDASTSDGAS